MRLTPKTGMIFALLSAVALAGCANTGSTPSSTPSATTEVVPVTLTSSAIHGTRLPAAFTCDAGDISPPLTWGALPAGVEEVALFAIGSNGRRSKTVEWAMAGIKPTLRDLHAGERPRGAFVLKSGDGRKRYSICPARGETGHYEFAVFAMPRLVRASPQMSGAELLKNLTEPSSAQYLAAAIGTLPVTYRRR